MIYLDKGKCENFIFYENIEKNYGICRRYPPTVYSGDENNTQSFLNPVVSNEEWCGEFNPKDPSA